MLIPGWGVCDFFRFCQGFTSTFPSLSPFPSSSFPSPSDLSFALRLHWVFVCVRFSKCVQSEVSQNWVFTYPSAWVCLVHYAECNARVLWMSLATVNKPSIFHSHFCSVHFICGFVCTKPECKWNFHTKDVTSCSATQLWCTGLWSARLDSRSGPDRLGHVYRMQSPVLYRTVWGWSRSCAKVSLILLWNAVLKDEHWKKGVGRQSSYLYKKFDFAVCWCRLADTWCVLCGQDLIQAPRTAEYQKQYAAVLLELETLNAVIQGLSSVYCVSSLGLSLASVHSNIEKMCMPKL